MLSINSVYLEVHINSTSCQKLSEKKSFNKILRLQSVFRIIEVFIRVAFFCSTSMKASIKIRIYWLLWMYECSVYISLGFLNVGNGVSIIEDRIIYTYRSIIGKTFNCLFILSACLSIR